MSHTPEADVIMLESKTSSWLLDLLSLIRVRPGAFLGSEEVRTLSAFLWGYRAARIDLGAPEFGGDENSLLQNFTTWLKVRYADDRDVSWETLIEDAFLRTPTTIEFRRRTSPTDGSAKLFFKLFEEFLADVQLRYKDERDVWKLGVGGIFRLGVGERAG
jgi:hypothetical protein